MSPFVQERGKALVSAIQRGFVGQEDDAKMAGFRRFAKAAAMHHQDLLLHEELTDENLVPSATVADTGFPVQFCPVCSKRLESWRCKMVCPRCAYFMSCSEFE